MQIRLNLVLEYQNGCKSEVLSSCRLYTSCSLLPCRGRFDGKCKGRLGQRTTHGENQKPQLMCVLLLIVFCFCFALACMGQLRYHLFTIIKAVKKGLFIVKNPFFTALIMVKNPFFTALIMVNNGFFTALIMVNNGFFTQLFSRLQYSKTC